MPPRLSHQQRTQYHHLRFVLGLTRAEAAKEAGVSYSWAKGYDGLPAHGAAYKQIKEEKGAPKGPVDRDKLNPEAAAALDDFGLFRRRYFGASPHPGRRRRRLRMVELEASPQKEFVVVNCPPVRASPPCSPTTFPRGSPSATGRSVGSSGRAPTPGERVHGPFAADVRAAPSGAGEG